MDRICTRVVLSVISLNCRSLTSLCLPYKMLYLEHYNYLGNFVSDVTELEIDCVIDWQMANFITAKLSSNLKCLSLAGKCVSNKRIVFKIFMDTENLEHLCIKGRMLLRPADGDDLDIGLDGFDAPTVLSKSSPMKSFTFWGFQKLVKWRVVEFIIRNFPSTLEYFNLSYSTPFGLNIVSQEPLPKLDNMKIFAASSNICYIDDEKLPVSKQIQLTNQLITVLKLMPNLRVLDLSWNYHVTFSGVDVIDVLSQYCPLLEELHLSNCCIPAEKLISLQKLEFLTRLRLDHENLFLSPSVPEHNLIASFKAVASILPFLKQLEYLTMKDYRKQPRVDDIVLFFNNAGPTFKSLALSAAYKARNFDFNFIEEALKKCHALPRTYGNRIDLIVDKIECLHTTSCYKIPKSGSYNYAYCKACPDCRVDSYFEFYSEIAPDFIRLKLGDDHNNNRVSHFYDQHFAFNNSSKFLNKRIACKYVDIPNITI